jgi:hypothetical protein
VAADRLARALGTTLSAMLAEVERSLEETFRDREPMLAEVQAAWGRMAERAGAKLCGEDVDEGQRIWDRDTVERWATAEGADLETEAQKARQKLMNVGRAQP